MRLVRAVIGPLRRLAGWLAPAGRRSVAPRADTDGELLVLRTLCHELRPPVSTLGSLLRALDQGQGPAGVDGHGSEALARLAVAHARHLEDLLREAAAVAEGLSGGTDGAGPVELGTILPELAASVPAGRLDLRVSPAAAGTPVHPRHTRQILINLLGNALRHGPPGGRVELIARTRGRSLILTVRDEGELTAELDHALHRDAAPAGMHGLGLWLVRRLAGRHGGSVRAHPVSSGGVAVSVVLPRQPLSRRGQRMAR